jgi:hypothetical protein
MRARWVVTGLALALGASGAARADGAFPDSDSIVVPASLPGEIVLGTNFGVLLSVDDGDTWTWTCEQAGNTFGSHYQMGAPPLNRLFTQARVGGVGALAYSDDASCSWQAAGGALAGATVVDAFPDPTDAGRVLALVSRAGDAGMSYEAWASDDGGATFATRLYASATQLTGVETARSDPATVYLTLVGGADGGTLPELLRSTDGGASWTVHDLSAGLGTHVVNLRLIAVDPGDAATVFLRVSAGGGEQVAITRDGGATVAPVLALAAGVVTAFARLPASGDLVVGGTSGLNQVAFRSTDGGASFQPLPTPPRLRALAARGARLYAAADNYVDGYAVGASDDEGMTWQPLVSYAPGGTSIAPHAIEAIAACVATACRADCLTRASMSQWAPDLCSATPPEPGLDGGETARDAAADGAGTPRDAAADRAGTPRDAAVDRARPASSGGCGCRVGGPPGAPALVLFVLIVLPLASAARRGRGH